MPQPTSPVSSSAPTSSSETWPALTLIQRRILGVLIEKAKTTPDAYPLSLNALVTGCNQKSNRDPVMDLDEEEVEQAGNSLKAVGLVTKVLPGASSSSRVERWRHNVYDAWRVNKQEAAVLAELLLRGPQTEGELRGRAARMEPIEDLEQLRSILKPLAERKLVIWLTPESRRGAILTHGFHSPEELARLRETMKHSSGDAEEFSRPPASTSPPQPSIPPKAALEKMLSDALAPLTAKLTALEAEQQKAQAVIAELQTTLADQKAATERLNRELRDLQQQLGITPPK